MRNKLSSDEKAGLYITVIFHLVVLIILLATQIGVALQKENSFVIDFTKVEEAEEIKKEENLKEEISQKVASMIASAQGSAPVRNIAVDRSGMLKDDRNTDAKQLYEDAARLQKELNAGAPQELDDDYVPLPSAQTSTKNETKKMEYSGPSVVSYYLEGRKASHLSIPAYRCMGSGRVTVIIVVNPAGTVLNAKVQDDVSSSDACLRNFAIRAARLSKFSASASAPAKQVGNIVYEFIAQ